MGIVCKVAGHSVDTAAIVWNDGMSHSRCLRCGSHLIRRSSHWRAIPRGYRVVWRAPLAGETRRASGPIGWDSLFQVAASIEAGRPVDRPAATQVRLIDRFHRSL